jgi:hypothetical protein
VHLERTSAIVVLAVDPKDADTGIRPHVLQCGFGETGVDDERVLIQPQNDVGLGVLERLKESICE